MGCPLCASQSPDAVIWVPRGNQVAAWGGRAGAVGISYSGGEGSGLLSMPSFEPSSVTLWGPGWG